MKISTRAAVALATAATLVLGPTTVAHAAKNVRTDAAGDVVRVTDMEAGTWVDAPNANQGDIRRFIVDHRAHNVFLTGRFDDLVRGQQTHFFALPVLTDSVRRNVYVYVDPTTSGQGVGFMTNRKDDPVRCRNLTHKVDWANEVLRVKIPRSCLGGPTWVRSGLLYGRETPKGAFFYDESHRNGGTDAETIQMGPRVHRG